MVQVLPGQPSLAELLGSGLSQGLQTGLQQKLELAKALQLEQQKQLLKSQQQQQLLSQLGLLKNKTKMPADDGSYIPSQIDSQQSPYDQFMPKNVLETSGETQTQPLSREYSLEATTVNNLPYSEQQILGASVLGASDIAKFMMNANENVTKERQFQEKMAQQRTLAKDKRAFESNKPFFEEINKKRSTLPVREAAQKRILDAIWAPNLRTKRNAAAEYLSTKGFPAEFLKTASANELDSAVKNNYVEDLKSLPGGARLNQYIERTLKSALESPLKTPENNMIIYETDQFKNDVEKKQIEITDKLLDEYEAKGIEPPANFSRKIDKELQPYIADRQKELTSRIRSIKEGEINKPVDKDSMLMIDPAGNTRKVPKKQAIEAQKSGYRLI